jgi:hypothetical protein
MEQKKNNFRLRLNLFDGIVLVLALAVGAFLMWTALKPSAPAGGEAAPSTATVRYTVRFQKWVAGSGSLVEAGDKLVDNIKNYDLGTVVSAEVVPAQAFTLDSDEESFVISPIEDFEDVLVTVESSCTVSESGVIVGGGYPLRVGGIAYIRGEGYMASGPIISIEREGLE